MDKIVITDLEVWARIGVPDEERAKPQKLLVSVELGTDFSEAAASDDLSHTIDYDGFCRSVRAMFQNSRWKLLETVAVEIAQKGFVEFGAIFAAVEIKKFIIPQTQWVGVRIERNKV